MNHELLNLDLLKQAILKPQILKPKILKPKPFILTVRGPVSPSELGTCYAHEHLLGRPPPDTSDDPDFVLGDEEAAAVELKRFRRAGGRAVVEMSTADYGRDAAGLRRLSERTGVHIVCATGYNKDRFSARHVEGVSVGELTDRFAAEIQTGIDGTGVRAGLVKAASTLNSISPTAERAFRAAARTHRRTGAPISTHTEAGTMALEQIRLLESEGVDPSHVLIGHMDRRLDVAYHLEVAATGAALGYDQISKEKYYPDVKRAESIAALVDEGYGSHVVLGGDLARRSYWPAYGFAAAPGFSFILERFVPRLWDVGLGEVEVDDLLIHNPARILTFAAPSEDRSDAGSGRGDDRITHRARGNDDVE
ncbi:MAG: hypothetical protein WD423_09955 [Rhodothermales bacterium]